MVKQNIYIKVDWRKYLDPTNNPRVRRFLIKNGSVIFKEIVENIKKAIQKNDNEIAILVHPNVSAIVIIKKSEFITILNHCINYFISIEDYTECIYIRDIKNKLSNKSNRFW